MDIQNISQSLAGFSSNYTALLNLPVWLIAVLVFTMIWKFAWYGIALYHSGTRKKKSWFVVLFVLMFILNDLGLLPILYLIFNKDKKQKEKPVVANKKKK